MYRAAWILLAISLAYAAVGLSTFFWRPVPARLLSIQEKSLPYSASPASYRYQPLLSTRAQPPAQGFYKASYRYAFQGDTYRSSFIGLYFPTASAHNSFYAQQRDVTAYVCPWLPRFSVLVQGFQLTLMLPVLIVAALGLWYLGPLRLRWLKARGRFRSR